MGSARINVILLSPQTGLITYQKIYDEYHI